MERHNCDYCNKSYKYKKVLDKHILSKHNDVNNEANNVVNDEANNVVNDDLLIKPLKPIIKWSGGKYDEISKFISHVPETYNTYLEPFIGGAAVMLHLRPNKAVIGDVHKELIDFYTSIKKGYINEIYNFMEENPNNEITYYNIRDKMDYTTELENAKRFYYLRKTCFRGMMRYNSKGKFNIPYGKYKTVNYSDLQNTGYEEQLKNCEIINESYEYMFENYNCSDNFMFLDPPYDSEFTDYGYCSFNKEHQRKLADYFKSTQIKCLMIIGKTDFICELYNNYIVDEYDKKYKFRLHSNRIGNEINTKHLIIKNY